MRELKKHKKNKNINKREKKNIKKTLSIANIFSKSSFKKLL